MNWCKILGHKWYHFRYKVNVTKCKRCGKYRKSKTLQEEWDEVGKAFRELVAEVEKTWPAKFLNWLAKKWYWKVFTWYFLSGLIILMCWEIWIKS